MRIVNYNKILSQDKKFLLSAKMAAERSVTENKHRVGCILICANGPIYKGATVARTRAIGSTCAERMALDQWYFSNIQSLPTTCYIIATFDRASWSDNSICTPCGVCLEMFLELFIAQKLNKLRFVCGNWKLTRALITDLRELFPQVGKRGWPYTKYIGIR